MTYTTWRITIENWAFNGVDPKLAGDRRKDYIVEADGIDMAVSFAHAIVEGIRSNPSVWQSPIVGIVKVQP